MLLALASHLLCAWFAFALPAYATYKALARPAPPDALPALAMYWTVLALFFALDQSLGLVLSVLPFYWELRTIFLLYIALPQTQGATYLYKSFLHPWCAKNEAHIDAAVASAQSNASAFCRARIAALADLAATCLNSPARDPHTPAQSVDHITRLWAACRPSLVAAFGLKDASDAHVTPTAGQSSAAI